jgi:hypothetical protein
MRQHQNAGLTIIQRREIKRLYQQEQVSVQQLKKIYQVSEPTIRKWVKRDNPYDLSSRPHRISTVITESYRQAVLDYRKANDHHGPIQIAYHLKAQYAFANRGTVLKILQEQKLTTAKKGNKAENHLPVGRHRIQMDVQQLPVVAGGSGFEYKISLIHLATRFKYSEIHPKANSRLLRDVFERALDVLPPFLESGQIMP